MREIGWAVSRFLFPACRAKSGNSADDVQTNIVLLANTFLAPDDSACVRVGHAWPSIRIFAYVIMMFLPSQLSSVGELRDEVAGAVEESCAHQGMSD